MRRIVSFQHVPVLARRLQSFASTDGLVIALIRYRPSLLLALTGVVVFSQLAFLSPMLWRAKGHALISI